MKKRLKKKKIKRLISELIAKEMYFDEDFVTHLHEINARYIDGEILLETAVKELSQYEVFKRMIAVVCIDEDECKHIPLSILQCSCILDLFEKIDSELFREAWKCRRNKQDIYYVTRR